jgi:predicted Zn-dependent peptidase
MLSVSVAALLLLLGQAPPQQAPQAPDRSKPPAAGPPPALKLPAIQKLTLANGLPVWLAEHHEVPVVTVNLVLPAGSAVDPQGRFGLASLTSAMLDEGAGSRSALEIADAIDFLGATLTTASAMDSAAVRLYVPVARLKEAVPIMADVALRPTFPAEELERLREERLTSIMQARDDPRAIASIGFPRLVYGREHRYGTAMVGTTATVREFSVAHLREFYGAHYRPEGSALIVAGDVSAGTVLPLLESAFGGWKAAGSAPARASVPSAPQHGARTIYLIDKPGAAQSQIRIGLVGVARNTPDYFALQVLNTVFGGTFSSRLNQNLREQHGYSYGANSAFDMRLSEGPFIAAAGVQTDKTAESLTEFFKEFTRILEPVPDNELGRAKSFQALSFPGEFETTREIAGRLESLIVYKLPDDYYAKYIPAIEAVTAQDVQRVAKKYLLSDKFAVVVVGDLKTIETPVRALKLGAVNIVTLDDAME